MGSDDRTPTTLQTSLSRTAQPGRYHQQVPFRFQRLLAFFMAWIYWCTCIVVATTSLHQTSSSLHRWSFSPNDRRWRRLPAFGPDWLDHRANILSHIPGLDREVEGDPFMIFIASVLGFHRLGFSVLLCEEEGKISIYIISVVDARPFCCT